jgi:hypothetical protein
LRFQLDCRASIGERNEDNHSFCFGSYIDFGAGECGRYGGQSPAQPTTAARSNFHLDRLLRRRQPRWRKNRTSHERIVAEQKGIDPALVEKDYWIMHCLYGLQRLGLVFELKGGTSLSKGFQIINRFSEDIDIRIEPPTGRDVKTRSNQNKRSHIQSRRDFYDWLTKTIRIDGVEKVERDTAFDNRTLMSGGIRLFYKTYTKALAGLRSGVLLELGFDDVTPNAKKNISSWLYDYAASKIEVIDNRANGVACYDPGYTFAEKLQTVSTKLRKQQGQPDRFHAALL